MRIVALLHHILINPSSATILKILGILFLILLSIKVMGQHAPPIVIDVHGSGDSDPKSLSKAFIGGSINQEVLIFNATTGFFGQGFEPRIAENENATLIRDIEPGGNGSSPDNFTPLNGLVYFFANNSAGNGALWQTNGTFFGTRQVRNLNPSGDSQGNFMINAGGTLFFAATNVGTNSTNGNVELWKSDGTDAGTQLAVDINPSSSGGSFPERLTHRVIGGSHYVFFSADPSTDAASGPTPDRLLYVYDVAADALSVAGAPGTNNPRFFTAYNNRTYFVANNAGSNKLMVSDGTAASVVGGFPSGLTVSNTVRPVVSGDKLFFRANNNLWSYEAATNTFAEVLDASNNSITNPEELTDVNGILLFEAEGVSAGGALWQGAGNNTFAQSIFEEPTPGIGFNFVNLTNIDGLLYFFVEADQNPNRADLWWLDPITGNSNVLYDFETNGAIVRNGVGEVILGEITPVGNDFYFKANGAGRNASGTLVPNPGRELWYAQGCPQIVLDYGGTVLCQSGGTVTPDPTTLPACGSGNCFSFTPAAENPGANLALDVNTGAIDLPSSDEGTYTITFSVASGGSTCEGSVEITIKQDASARLEVITAAGTPGSSGTQNGALLSSQFNFGSISDSREAGVSNEDAGISVSLAPGGQILYVADEFNHVIRRIDLANDIVSVLAGSIGNAGFQDGIGTAAQFRNPSGIAVDGTGIIYVADKFNHIVRRIDPTTGQVTTIAGSPGTEGVNERFNQPSDVVVDANGNVYVADKNNHRIKVIRPNGIVEGVTGIDQPSGSSQGFANGTLAAARFNFPSGLDIDGNLIYVADLFNNVIRLVDITGGVVSTFAGMQRTGAFTGANFADGPIGSAQFKYPADISIGPDGTIYVADRGNHLIRAISGGNVTTFAGSSRGFQEGPALTAQFNNPSGVAAGLDENVYVVDKNNQVIRRVFPNNPAGTILGAATVCPGNNSGVLELTDFTGSASNILRWETSTDGQNFSDAGNGGNTQFTYNNLTVNTQYQVVIQDALCGILTSNVTTVEVDGPEPPTVLRADTVCGDPANPVNVTLVAQGGSDGEFRWYDVPTGGTPLAGEDQDTLVVSLSASQDYYVSVEINGCETSRTLIRAQITPPPAPNLVAATEVCEADVVTYTIETPTPANDYAWTVLGGTLTSSGTTTASGTGMSSIEVIWGSSGAAQVEVIESTPGTTVCSTTFTLDLTVQPQPALAVTDVTGTNLACLNQTTNYTVPAEAGHEFSWTVTGGTIEPGGTTTATATNTIDVQWNTLGAGLIQITKTNTTTNCAITLDFPVTVNNAPTPVLSGPTEVCVGDTVSYSATTSGDLSWVISGGRLQGTTDSTTTAAGPINVIWGSTGPYLVSLTETDPATTCATTTDLVVSVSAVPAPAIKAPSPEACLNETLTYRLATSTPGNSYTWTVTGGLIQPENTATVAGQIDRDSIQVTWTTTGAGVITLRETSPGAAGCFGTSEVTITVNDIPSPVVQGQPLACEGRTQFYQAENPDPNSSYTWTVTGGTIQPENTTTIVSELGRGQVEILWEAAGAGRVEVSEENTSGCSVEAAALDVNVVGIPDPSVTGQFADVCAGDTLMYQAAVPPAGINYLYEWRVEGGMVLSGAGTNQLTIAWNEVPSGADYVILRIQIEGSDCADSTDIPAGPGDPGFVSINPLPDPVITSADTDKLTTVCEGEAVVYQTEEALDATSTYVWNVNGGTFTQLNPNEIEVTWGNAGTGSVDLLQTLATGCSRSAPLVSVSIVASPGLPTTNDRFVCNAPQDIELIAEEPTANTFRWYDADTEGNLLFEGLPYLVTVNAPTTIYVAGVNGSGCEGPRQAINIAVDPPNSTVGLQEIITNADSCVVGGGDSPSGRIELMLTDNNLNGPYAFAWSQVEDAGFSATTQNLSGLVQGTYEVMITDGGGCVTMGGPYVVAEELKLITDGQFINDTTIAEGEPLILAASATDAAFFEFLDADGNTLASGTDSSFTITPPESTSYTVIITNDRNCSTTLTVNVEVIPLELFIPNSFSPNGDNNNERFKVYGTGIQAVQLRIFNRLGQLLFTTGDWIEGDNFNEAVGWDGTFKGQPQENGNYVWSLTGTDINNQAIKKSGNVLLIR